MEWVPLVQRFDGPQHFVGADQELYFAAAHRYLSGESFYLPAQLSGSYTVDLNPVLYPPELIALVAPLMLVPIVMWWAIPIGVLGLALWWHRPSIIAAPLVAACLAWPETTLKVFTGNPGIWTAAFLAIGTIKPAASALVLLKPSLFPFALIGVRDGRWWLLAVLAFAPFAWLLPDYLVALRNFDSPLGPFYSIREAPLLAIPVIVWLCGRHRPALVDRVVAGIVARSPELRLSVT